ncbi:hypothetical protein [Propionivibrio sp.]|uniref:hypothetical protein n=1 Tax=Propionivibrio sp. TaxID=2212460 RepID=UPI00260CD7BE|nr:hypothetical protein [Propionivibrio sp.]
MADPIETDDVKIFAPDKSLLIKIGVANLDHLLSPQVVASAQSVIEHSADQFLTACLHHLAEIDRLAAALQQTPNDTGKLLPSLVQEAFEMKVKAGMGGYELASALAKSLHLYCEQIGPNMISQRNFEIIAWHATSVRTVLHQRLKGSTGATGAAIMMELDKLQSLWKE